MMKKCYHTPLLVCIPIVTQTIDTVTASSSIPVHDDNGSGRAGSRQRYDYDEKEDDIM